MAGSGTSVWSRWRPTLGDLGDALGSLVTTAVGLGLAITVVDGASADGWVPVLWVAVAVAVGDLLLRAPLRLLARLAGAMGALVAGLAAQVLVAWAALTTVPGVHVDDGWAVVAVLVVTSLVMAAGRWLIGANDSEYVLGDIIRRARRKARRGAGPAPTASRPGPGLLIVQLDGVGAPVLEQAIEAGLAPTMARWLASGTHRLDRWWVRVPSTTPASQAGLLHGRTDPIPAFRWWDRSLGRMVVTNHPVDAALVEERLSDGKGLLAFDGVAISTMFTGDARTSMLVMSRSRQRGGIGPGQSFLRFFASPFVLTRAVALSLLEMVKELYQARHQRVRGVEPRVSRRGWYVVLRGVTNVLMRDLTTSLVAEQLVRGAPVVFVDLVDYDEIAHHAGPTRPESLRALEGLDRVLGIFEQVAVVAPREYRVVVLSDHGQSLGATFAQLEGRPLLDLVRALMADPAAEAVAAGDGEDWGPLNTLLTSTFGRADGAGHVALGPDREARARTRAADAGAVPEVAVIASGNLALVWFPRADTRLTLEDLQERWPGLVAGLAARPGIGLVVADTRDRGLVAVGPRGLALLERDAEDGSGCVVEGEDPLAPFGPRGRADVARAARLENSGDLLLLSAADAAGRVHAFEGQVGSHGGLGGDQNDALLLHPATFGVDDDLRDDVGGSRRLVGAEQVHEQLVRWSRELGLRP